MVLFLAGQDDMTAALCWCWCLLAQHPSIETRFYDEVDRVVGNRLPTYADLPSLALTSSIVKETLRLYPPTWTLMPRVAARDIKIGDCEIRRGTWVLISPYVTHRDPRFFSNAGGFDPDRFSVDRDRQIEPFAYLPFGGGPRSCIGMHLSHVMLVVALASIARRFRILFCQDPSGIRPEPGLSLGIQGGVRVRIQSIDRPTADVVTSVHASHPAERRVN
jgi:cytochrome P450